MVQGGSAFDVDQSEAIYRGLEQAGFSRSDARRALNDSTAPRHDEAMAIVQGVVSAKGGNAQRGLSQPKAQSALLSEGLNNQQGTAAAARDEVGLSNRANDATLGRERRNREAHGKAMAQPPNSGDVANRYAGTAQQAITGQGMLARQQALDAGLNAYAKWAFNTNLTSKGPAAATMASPEAVAFYKNTAKNSLNDPRTAQLVEQVGEYSKNGLPPDEASMKELDARLGSPSNKIFSEGSFLRPAINALSRK